MSCWDKALGNQFDHEEVTGDQLDDEVLTDENLQQAQEKMEVTDGQTIHNS